MLGICKAYLALAFDEHVLRFWLNPSGRSAPQGTDENEDGHTYAEYRAMQIRALHPDIMGHPGAALCVLSLCSCALPVRLLLLVASFEQLALNQQALVIAHPVVKWSISHASFFCLHPPTDPLVETASLASVPLPPPSFNHSLHDCVEGRLLSDAQLETIVYANMKFSGPRLQTGQRAGFFLGDGEGWWLNMNGCPAGDVHAGDVLG